MGHETFGDPCDRNPAALLKRDRVVGGLEGDRGRVVVPEADARLQVQGHHGDRCGQHSLAMLIPRASDRKKDSAFGREGFVIPFV